MKYIVLLLTVFWAAVAIADYPNGSHKAAKTRFGVLQVTGDLGAMRISLNGSDLGIEDWSINIDGVWAVEGEAQDWAVLTVHFGGNACEAPKMILRLSNGSVTRTDTFGVCKGGATDLRFYAGAVEIAFSDSATNVAERRFRFDGAALTDTVVPVQAVADTLGGGAAVTRWLGQHPQAMVQDPSEQARLSRILSPTDLDEMSRRLSGPGSTTQQGNWIVGRACQAHQCNTAAAAWALRISDGAPFAVFYNASGPVVFAGNQQFADPVIAALIRKTF